VVPTAIVGSEGARNWKRLQFPKVTVQYGKPIRFEQVDEPTRDQAQGASEMVFAEVRAMHGALTEHGRRRAVQAARAARRAARAARRRPITP
jgi:1-acyl-sn-glycerol-3-phosphate acyltransferase